MKNCKGFVTLPVVYIDGELLHCVDNRLFNTCMKIKDVITKHTWDARDERFKLITALFIDYQGIEYGVALTKEELLTLLEQADPDTVFRNFDFEFDFEFE